MKVFEVGGCIRDELLGLDPKDKDYVVVGATPEQMLSEGFKKVGADFPTFLHPATNDQYALARTERKCAPGYHGFSVSFDPSVTLEDDLYRRDLTINAMARDPETNKIHDPYNGQQDLQNGILRHVSEAFVEDPVRILRVARFAARYDFTVADSTKTLMSKLAKSGELSHLTVERVWNEVEKALGEKYPHRFLEVLQECGALLELFPEMIGSSSTVVFMEDAAFRRQFRYSAQQQFALWTSELLPQALDQLLKRLKVPKDFSTLATVTCTLYRKTPHNWIACCADTLMTLLADLNAWRDPATLYIAAEVTQFLFDRQYEHNFVNQILKALDITSRITFKSLSKTEQTTLKGKEIALAIERLRLTKLREYT